MKIKNIFAVLALGALSLTACNNYNDHFEGLEEQTGLTDVQSLEYTLVTNDYSSIASNATNQELAGDESDVLAAIGVNKYFASSADAAKYIPAFIAASTNWKHLSAGSTMLVTYTRAIDMPEQVAAMNDMKSYSLTADDYKTIWGSDEEYIEAVTPATASKLASGVSTEDLEAGDYVVVSYKYAASEPKFGDEEEQPAGYTSVLGAAALNDVVDIRGYVVAASSQGIIVADNGGAVLLYQTTDFAVGDEVSVNGKITSYNTGFQIEKANVYSIEKTGTTSVAYPEPLELTGSVMDEILVREKDAYEIFVKVTCTVSVSGNYYNFSVEGATAASGSFYGLTDDQKALLKDGETVTMYGYLNSISKSGGAPKYVNIIPTHINETPVIDNGYTNVLGSAVLNDVVDIKGYVVAASSQGIIVADNGGAILLYQTTDFAVGDKVNVNGKITSYNTGFQIEKANVYSIEKVGTMTVVYPEPLDLTGSVMDEILVREKDAYEIFVKVTCTVSVSGNYYNFSVEGATAASGSFYGLTDDQKALLKDGETVTMYGYLNSISKSGGAPKYVNIIPTHINTAPAAAKYVAAPIATRAAATASVNMYAVYKYDGSSLATVDAAIVQPADYTEMGQSYGNFTDPDQDKYLPKFLAKSFPYAMADDVKYVVFRKYVDSANVWSTDEYTFDGSAWVKNVYFEDKTDQFRKISASDWKVDPTLELNYLTDGTAEFKAFCQYCANWVYDNIDVPLGAPARDNAGVIIDASSIKVNGANPAGSFFVSSYGNNEWYAGTYAYYGEMNWRADNARASFEAAGYTGLTDAEIVEKMQMNAAEVFQNVLHYMYPDVTENDYTKVIINVYNYYNKVEIGAVRGVFSYSFNVVGKGEFEYIEGSFGPLE